MQLWNLLSSPRCCQDSSSQSLRGPVRAQRSPALSAGPGPLPIPSNLKVLPRLLKQVCTDCPHTHPLKRYSRTSQEWTWFHQKKCPRAKLLHQAVILLGLNSIYRTYRISRKPTKLVTRVLVLLLHLSHCLCFTVKATSRFLHFISPLYVPEK